MANEQIEPVQSYVAEGDNGTELLLMLFPEGWVCISVRDTEKEDGTTDFLSTFVRLEDLDSTIKDMKEKDNGAEPA